MNNTMIRAQVAVIRGDVECLNCGRNLAAAIKRLSDGAIKLTKNREGAFEVQLVSASTLRCTRCGGRACLDFDTAA